MSDLINGREMLNRYQVDLCHGIACKDCSMCTEDGGCRIEKWIDTFPSADRPQGEWEMQEDIDGLYGICSICGRDADFSHYYKAYNFCPNCGARMKGADDE